MKLIAFFLAALAPLVVAGCSGAFLGHLAVLAVTLGIFFGTLSLGKQPKLAEGAAGTGGRVETKSA